MKIYLDKNILQHTITREQLNNLFDSYGTSKLAAQTEYKEYRKTVNDLDKFIVSRLSLPYVKIQNKDAFVRVDYIIDYTPEKIKWFVKTWFTDIKAPESRIYKQPLTFFIKGD